MTEARSLRRVCVFCGSNAGAEPAFADMTRGLADELIQRRIELVYGGGNVGLMGILANRMLEHGGHVIGIIPSGLAAKEVAHETLPELRVVASMHERKAQMADLSDAFVALPGGLGTLEELFETLTWAQLGIHDKACGLLDVNGFYRPLLAFLDDAVEARLLAPQHRAMLLVKESPAALLDAFEAYVPPHTSKWLGPEGR
jgi:uncharacterized protein (TIGR00730 family)